MRAVLTALLCRVALLGLVVFAVSRPASGQNLIEQDADLLDRPVSAITIDGADDLEQFVRNNLRAAIGDPYDGTIVREDVKRLYDLGRFMNVTAEAKLLDDGTVAVAYLLTKQPIIRAVQTVGNKAFSDQELRAIIQQVPGGPRDQFLIECAKRDIKTMYRKKGFYRTEVSIDESELDNRGLLIMRVIEGPRVKVKAIEFDGVKAFPTKAVQAEIKTRTHVLLLRPGVLDEDVLTSDKAAIDRFYKNRGYLDVRVGHSIQLSPDDSEVKVTFHIKEGRRFRLGAVRTERSDVPGAPLEVFTPGQLAAMLEIKTGDVYSVDKLRSSVRIVEEAYGLLGYLDVRVNPDQIRRPPPAAEVDLVLSIDEGRYYKVGLIHINGNFLTKDKIVRRLVKLKPGRPYDTEALRESTRRLQRTRLFNDVRVTIQDPADDEEEYRDLLIDVKERNTGSLNFGLAVGSDEGVFGDFSLVQNNFDVADLPASLGELVSGRAFRGAGQRLNLVFRPGDEIFQYSASLTEPHLFESDYSLTVSGLYRQREYNDYDEERLTGAISLSRSLGDIWQVGTRFRAENVELTAISPDVPTEVFRDAGPDDFHAVGVTLTRTTIPTLTRPGQGSRLELSFDTFGLFGGDLDFYKAEMDYTVFVTLDEDFLGRKSTLKLRSRVGYIWGGRSPTYERFYLGGRSFRGFDFREVSPKGVRADTGTVSDDPVGGDWLLFLGTQYEFPLFQEAITGVVFVDSGTVVDEAGFDDYRYSGGVGLRLYIPQLGPVPIAIDLGWPIRKQDGDDTRVLSFSAELPF